MSDLADSIILHIANDYFDVLADQLRERLEALPSADASPGGSRNLFEQFRDDFDRGVGHEAGQEWRRMLHGLLKPMIDILPLPLQRALCFATENGWLECKNIDKPEEIPVDDQWIFDEVFGRLGVP